MRRVVVDASALAAVVFVEPEADAVAARLHRAAVYAPPLLRFELANTAWKKMRNPRSPDAVVLAALEKALQPREGIIWHEVNHPDVILIARAIGISTYDATYLWLAGWLGAELVTLDTRLSAALLATAEI